MVEQKAEGCSRGRYNNFGPCVTEGSKATTYKRNHQVSESRVFSGFMTRDAATVIGGSAAALRLRTKGVRAVVSYPH